MIQEEWAKKEYIAQGCLTNSKHRNCFTENFPKKLQSGIGCYVQDPANKTYIDFICGLGAMSIGYKNAHIDSAVFDQISQGVTFSLPHPIENQSAEFLLSEFLTPYDKVKYLKTGAEATSAAIRIARVQTGRQWIYTTGYHGWHDSWISSKLNPQGVPEKSNLYMREFETLEELMLNLSDKPAAVIIEPIMLEHSEQNTQKLFKLKKKCEDNGIILIFDEIVCGSRIPETFISKVVVPDLVCIGKGIANGYPLSAVIGRNELMEQNYFVSSTFAGETLSLRAHYETMKYFKNNPFKYVYEEANKIMDLMKLTFKRYVDIEGYGTRGFIKGSPEKFGLLQQEMSDAGMLIHRSIFMNYSHGSISKNIQSLIQDVIIKMNGAELKGRPPTEPFKRV